jgi:Flp pilus assembly protein TadD
MATLKALAFDTVPRAVFLHTNWASRLRLLLSAAVLACVFIATASGQTNATNAAAAKAYSAGMAAARTGDLATAEAELEKAAKLNPGDAQTQLELGKVLLHRGDVAGSTAHLTEAIKLNPGLAQPHFYLGQILAVEGQWDEAVAQLQQASKRAPKDAEPHRALARVFNQQGKAAGAGQTVCGGGTAVRGSAAD